MSGILGPAVGAAMVAAGGLTAAFALNAASFAISAGCVLPLFLPYNRLKPGPDQAPTLPASSNLWEDASAGLQQVMKTSWLWITIAVAALSNLTYLGRYKHIHRRGLKMYGVWMLIGLMVVFIGLRVGILGLFAAGLVIGAADTLLGLLWVNLLQGHVPHALLGRVSSLDYLGSSLLEPAGYALAGWAGGWLSPQAIFWVGGGLQTLLIALGLLHPDVRKLD